MSTNYASKFACGNKKCKGTLIPIQIRENKKDNTTKVLGKCPTCKKTFEFSLPLDRNAIPDWLPILTERMFTCTECGQPTLKTEKVSGNPKNEYKVRFECLECHKNSERYVDGGLFFLVEDKLPSAERTIITCTTCGQKITDESKKKCPKCGRDIFCAKCGSQLSPQAKFCAKCSAPVEIGDVMKKSIPVSAAAANICSTCGGKLAAGTKFCPVCGQEVVCNKCGNVLPPGAIFCNVCGDPISKGQEKGTSKSSKPMDLMMGKVAKPSKPSKR